MKIAVLLYGQPRFWKLSYDSIIQETTFPGVQTDYYFHFWDKIGCAIEDTLSDTEIPVTDNEKQKIINAYKPKAHLFTDYAPLNQLATVFYKKISKKRKLLEEAKVNLLKTIFEVNEPKLLNYFLGQFVSLNLGANLIKEEYDYIFRVRTDTLFPVVDLYDNTQEYERDKNIFYHNIFNKKEKGVFCKYGELQQWVGAVDVSGNHTDHQPEVRNTCEHITYLQDNFYFRRRDKSGCSVYNPNKHYIHLKDWYLFGSAPEMLTCMKSYLNTIEDLMEKSYKILSSTGIDVNWGAGELVCGENLFANKINAKEVGQEFIDFMKVPNRIIKIANRHTKECILSRPKIRVLADIDTPIIEQHKNIINNNV